MAHYVKGAVFFLYGFLTLGRWTGAFADAGWAWNILPEKIGRRRDPPSLRIHERMDGTYGGLGRCVDCAGPGACFDLYHVSWWGLGK
jgi:hypothetical protein